MRTSQFSTSAKDTASDADAAGDIAASDLLSLDAASAILGAIGADPVVRDRLHRLVEAQQPRVTNDATSAVDLEAAVDRLLSHLHGVIPDAVEYAVDDDSERMSNIRRLYLKPSDGYTLGELAALWCIPLDEVCAIYRDCSSFRISRSDAIRASRFFHIFRASEVERALGADFERVRSDAWRRC